MALSTVANLASGDVITETWVDSVTTNINDLGQMAVGNTPFPGPVQKFGNDANFQLTIGGGNSVLVFDSTDKLAYFRSSNRFSFLVGDVEKFAIDASGLIQGAAFTSTEQTITAGSTANIAHGLGTIPRFAFALYGTTTGAANCTNVVVPSFNSLGSYVRLSQVGGTNLVVVNGTAVTVYVYAFALR
jgi:hypothetical protein